MYKQSKNVKKLKQQLVKGPITENKEKVRIKWGNRARKKNTHTPKAWQLEQHVKTQRNLSMQMLNSVVHALC